MTSSSDFTDFPFSILLTGPFGIEIGFNSDQTVEVMNVTAESPLAQSYVTIVNAGSTSETLPVGRSMQQVSVGSVLLAASDDAGVKIMLAWKEA